MKVSRDIIPTENSSDELYSSCYKHLLKSYNIDVKKEYQFIYDEFLEHLISDTIKFIKDYKPNNIKNYIIFKNQFYMHIKSKDWYYKIITPEKCPEIIRKNRNNKLEKIKENYEN